MHIFFHLKTGFFLLAVRLYCTLYLFLKHIEVIDDDTDEQVEGKKRAKHNENDKETIIVNSVICNRLFVYIHRIYSVLHQLHPTFKGCLLFVCRVERDENCTGKSKMINDDFAYSSTRESCKSIITLAELERFSYNLKKRKISFQHIVEIRYRVNP